MAVRSDTGGPIVPQVAWGNGGGIGSPQDEVADLNAGPRIKQLMTLLPVGTRPYPTAATAIQRLTSSGKSFLDVRLSAEANTYNLGASGTALLIDQIVATTSLNYSDERLPVRIRVRCASCVGGYEPLKDGHVGATGPGGSYPVQTDSPETWFSDLDGNEHAAHIAMANSIGAAPGFSDGTFRPKWSMNREELAVLLVRSLRLPLSTQTTPIFSDVPQSHWAFAEIQTASKKSVLAGYTDGTFRPKAKFSRAELAGYLRSAAGWPLVSATQSSFTDVPLSYWASSRIETVHSWCHALEARPMWGTTFAPTALATREEATVAAMRMLNCLVGDEKK